MLAAAALAAAPAAAEETERPVKIGATYTTDALANVSGGLRRDTAWLGRADATLEAKGELLGLDGATFFFDLIYTHGPDFSGKTVGDAQVVSNVQGDGVLRPYEAWIDLPFGSGLSGKAGLIDLNTEFDVQTVGAFFTASSHGIGIDFSQSGANGPSIFPVTSAAAMLKYDGARATARLGLFNAVSGDPDRPTHFRLTHPGRDGSLLVAEGDVRIGARLAAQAGAWGYTSAQPVIDAPNQLSTGSKGAYAQLEWLAAEQAQGPQLQAWGRVGTADGTTNRVTAYVGGGATYGTDRSRIGFAVAHARQSGRAERYFAAQEGPQRRAETSLELGYAIAASDWLTVQPVAHYVINPGWRRDVGDALVGGVRLSFAFER
jgi:porin